jgi:hypothetical protein
MTSQVRWLIEGHVILVSHKGCVDMKNSALSSFRTLEMIRAFESNTVHTIYDFSETTGINMTLEGIRKTSKGVEDLPNVGWIMVINSPSLTLKTFINFITKVIGGFFQLKVQKAGSIEEALANLRDIDPDIPNQSSIQAQQDHG